MLFLVTDMEKLLQRSAPKPRHDLAHPMSIITMLDALEENWTSSEQHRPRNLMFWHSIPSCLEARATVGAVCRLWKYPEQSVAHIFSAESSFQLENFNSAKLKAVGLSESLSKRFHPIR